MRDLSRPGVKLTSPALADGFLTTGHTLYLYSAHFSSVGPSWMFPREPHSAPTNLQPESIPTAQGCPGQSPCLSVQQPIRVLLPFPIWPLRMSCFLPRATGKLRGMWSKCGQHLAGGPARMPPRGGCQVRLFTIQPSWGGTRSCFCQISKPVHQSCYFCLSMFVLIEIYRWFAMWFVLVSDVQQSYSVTHIYTHSFSNSFHYKLLQDTEYNSMCYTVGPYWFSILYIAVCTCESQPSDLCLPSSFPFGCH